MEKVITISKELAKKGDLVVIPREEYEEFAEWRAAMRSFRTFSPTAAQKRELRGARQDYKKGKYMTIDELKRRLDIKG